MNFKQATGTNALLAMAAHFFRAAFPAVTAAQEILPFPPTPSARQQD